MYKKHLEMFKLLELPINISDISDISDMDEEDLKVYILEFQTDILQLRHQMMALLEAIEQPDIEAEALQISTLETRTNNLTQELEQAQAAINEVASCVQPAGSSSG